MSGNANDDSFVYTDFTQITGNSRCISANMFFHYDLTDDIRFFAEGMYGFAEEVVQ